MSWVPIVIKGGGGFKGVVGWGNIPHLLLAPPTTVYRG